MKILIYVLGLLFVVYIITEVANVTGTDDRVEIAPDDPLNIGRDNVKSLVGKKVPYDKWDAWGPSVLQPTDGNEYIVNYLNKANISLVYDKQTEIVKFADLGEHTGIEFVKEKARLRKETIELQFSAWDGSHRNLTKVIKEAMNDPKSYEHIETVYYDKGDHLIVVTKYRGNNAFGGKVLGSVTAKVDLKGNVLEIISQD